MHDVCETVFGIGGFNTRFRHPDYWFARIYGCVCSKRYTQLHVDGSWDHHGDLGLTSLKEECDMGLMDKLKSLFKKSDKKDAAPKLNGTKMEAVQFKGEGRVPDALRYAANKLDAQVKAGKFDDKRASAFIAQLRECEASSLSDDEKLVQIGQIIGAITFL